MKIKANSLKTLQNLAKTPSNGGDNLCLEIHFSIVEAVEALRRHVAGAVVVVLGVTLTVVLVSISPRIGCRPCSDFKLEN